MPTPYDLIPEEVKKEAVKEAETPPKPKHRQEDVGLAAEDKHIGAERKQRRLFKRRRAGVVLSREEVRAIKIGRKKLRREMKARGIRSRREFELTAGSLGLYFDKRRPALLLWLGRHWLGALLGALAALLGVLFLFSTVQKMRGHFTVSLSDGLFREGFSLSDTVGFENPTTQLFATPAEGVPCISINQLPTDLDEIDGLHNAQYFAYTYYIRNEGESTVGYTWSLDINSKTQNLSDCVWALVFEDGVPRFYAKASNITGGEEALPPLSDNSRGYLTLPLRELAPSSDQFRLVKSVGSAEYWRVVPDRFLSDKRITEGRQEQVAPQDTHKYTVVLWLEGDDPEATDDAIGGHLGVEMNFSLVSEAEEEKSAIAKWWDSLWE